MFLFLLGVVNLLLVVIFVMYRIPCKHPWVNHMSMSSIQNTYKQIPVMTKYGKERVRKGELGLRRFNQGWRKSGLWLERVKNGLKK